MGGEGGGIVFCKVFLFYPLQCTATELYEETLNSKEKNSEDFVWISSMNSASGEGGEIGFSPSGERYGY